MKVEDNLKYIRRNLLKEIDNIDSPIKLYNIQSKIVHEIIEAENNYKDTYLQEYREHILLLRTYGDTLPWRILSPCNIEKLYDIENELTFLSDNKEKITNILNKAEYYAQKGNIIIIGAVTNYINTCDILICDDIENPLTIQCNDNYDSENIIDLCGFKKEKALHTLNSNKHINLMKKEILNKHRYIKKEPISNNWKILNDVVKICLQSEEAFEIIEDDDMIWAFKYNGEMPDIPEFISSKIKNYKLPVIGCHLRVIDEPELMICPPSCWPVDFDCRFALMEGDVALMHYIDAEAFKKYNKPHNFVKDILYYNGRLKRDCVVVENDNNEKIYSCKVVNSVVYGYSNIGEIANLIINYGVKA
ncbi:hypothetical protein [Clostridium sp. Marseille-Q2269]|uniref:hypothetical protein n=1 Tax=Clostridium sp. Marseille-Q2269 TaxID=2942205 RepID=UPI002073C4B0|nr:hypothetical protein [Clostridium sp. Marseille-Q2269]